MNFTGRTHVQWGTHGRLQLRREGRLPQSASLSQFTTKQLVRGVTSALRPSGRILSTVRRLDGGSDCGGWISVGWRGAGLGRSTGPGPRSL